MLWVALATVFSGVSTEQPTNTSVSTQSVSKIIPGDPWSSVVSVADVEMLVNGMSKRASDEVMQAEDKAEGSQTSRRASEVVTTLELIKARETDAVSTTKTHTTSPVTKNLSQTISTSLLYRSVPTQPSSQTNTEVSLRRTHNLVENLRVQLMRDNYDYFKGSEESNETISSSTNISTTSTSRPKTTITVMSTTARPYVTTRPVTFRASRTTELPPFVQVAEVSMGMFTPGDEEPRFKSYDNQQNPELDRPSYDNQRAPDPEGLLYDNQQGPALDGPSYDNKEAPPLDRFPYDNQPEVSKNDLFYYVDDSQLKPGLKFRRINALSSEADNGTQALEEPNIDGVDYNYVQEPTLTPTINRRKGGRRKTAASLIVSEQDMDQIAKRVFKEYGKEFGKMHQQKKQRAVPQHLREKVHFRSQVDAPQKIPSQTKINVEQENFHGKEISQRHQQENSKQLQEENMHRRQKGNIQRHQKGNVQRHRKEYIQQQQQENFKHRQKQNMQQQKGNFQRHQYRVTTIKSPDLGQGQRRGQQNDNHHKQRMGQRQRQLNDQEVGRQDGYHRGRLNKPRHKHRNDQRRQRRRRLQSRRNRMYYGSQHVNSIQRRRNEQNNQLNKKHNEELALSNELSEKLYENQHVQPDNQQEADNVEQDAPRDENNIETQTEENKVVTKNVKQSHRRHHTVRVTAPEFVNGQDSLLDEDNFDDDNQLNLKNDDQPNTADNKLGHKQKQQHKEKQVVQQINDQMNDDLREEKLDQNDGNQDEQQVGEQEGQQEGPQEDHQESQQIDPAGDIPQDKIDEIVNFQIDNQPDPQDIDGRRRNVHYEYGHSLHTTPHVKKYKLLKVASREARHIVEERGKEGVALISLDKAPVPEFRLPSGRRQYMHERADPRALRELLPSRPRRTSAHATHTYSPRY